jgi:hypothetical protein
VACEQSYRLPDGHTKRARSDFCWFEIQAYSSEIQEEGSAAAPDKLLTRPAKRTLVLGLVLVVVTVILYYPAIHHPFVNYDDGGYVRNNFHVQAGLTWDTVKWAFTTYQEDNWHPVTWLSHALDCQLFMYRKNKNPFQKGKRTAGHILGLMGDVSPELERWLEPKVGNCVLRRARKKIESTEICVNVTRLPG